MAATLSFRYGSMNSGKSTELLLLAYSYEERNQKIRVFIPKLLNKLYISPRIGITRRGDIFGTDFNFYLEFSNSDVNCIMVDEAQFLTKLQVRQLSQVVDNYNIPVICYGIKTDFKGELFEGSQYLLAWSDEISDIKNNVCDCGVKTIMNLRVQNTKEGRIAVQEGEKIDIGGNDKYISLCRKCFSKNMPTF
jgi:thymidine kinase